MQTLFRTTLAVAGVALAAGAQAQAQTEIKVSYQPALYWALPFYIATEKGWWAELGLKPVFSTFPAGVPQIAASASKSWDVGGTGSVPAVIVPSAMRAGTSPIRNSLISCLFLSRTPATSVSMSRRLA